MIIIIGKLFSLTKEFQVSTGKSLDSFSFEAVDTKQTGPPLFIILYLQHNPFSSNPVVETMTSVGKCAEGTSIFFKNKALIFMQNSPIIETRQSKTTNLYVIHRQKNI